jgi:hypothetical protein
LVATGKIFISYRREDAPGDARGVCDRLVRSFGKSNVFMDVDSLLAGQRFDRELDKALSKCDVLIAVIGSRWMELLSEYTRNGKRDFVHDEIVAALKRDIVVIPVMIGREANMPPLPPLEDLPENMRELALYQKHNIAHESFARDAAELTAAIKTVLNAKRGVRPWRTVAVAAVIGLAITAALLGSWMDMLPRIGPGSFQHSEPATPEQSPSVRAVEQPATKAAEQDRSKANMDSKAADDSLQKYGELRRGWLGVRIQPVTDEIAESLNIKPARGALVADVDDKGAAKAAGIEPGDVVVRFDGKDVKEPKELARVVTDTTAGKEVDVVIVRKGAEQTRKVTLGRLDAPLPAAAKNRDEPVAEKSLGLDLAALSQDLRSRYKIKDSVKGVIITSVDGTSEAAEKRLVAGDVIVEFAQEAVGNAADVKERVEQLKKDGKKTVLLLVSNPDGGRRFVALSVQ